MTAHTHTALRALGETRTALSTAERTFAEALAADLQTLRSKLSVVAKGERVTGTINAERQQQFIILRTMQLLTEHGQIHPFLDYMHTEMEMRSEREEFSMSSGRTPIHHLPKTLPKALGDYYRQACREYVAHVHPEEKISLNPMSRRTLLAAGIGAAANQYFQMPFSTTALGNENPSSTLKYGFKVGNAVVGGYAGGWSEIALDVVQSAARYSELLNSAGTGKAAIYAHKYTFDALYTTLKQTIETLAQQSQGTSRA